MKWLLCGLTFALAVGLAIGTAAIRAGNTCLRRELERDYRRIEARVIELGRLQALAVEQRTPEKLAQQLRTLVQPPRPSAGQEALPWQ